MSQVVVLSEYVCLQTFLNLTITCSGILFVGILNLCVQKAGILIKRELWGRVHMDVKLSFALTGSTEVAKDIAESGSPYLH